MRVSRDHWIWFWVAGVCLFLFVFGQPTQRFGPVQPAPTYNPADPQRSTQADKSSAEQAGASASPSEKKLSKAEIYERACNTPKDYQEADLCEQRRVADATELALFWTKFQTAIGTIGTLLILGGLWASAISAWAAAEATSLSRKSLQMTHGAFLEIKDFTIMIAMAERRFDITYKIHNGGKSNAIIEYVCGHFSVAKELPDRPTYNIAEGTKHAMEIMAGDDLVMEDDPTKNKGLSKEVFVAIQQRKAKYFFYGVVAYKNVFGNAFERGFVREAEVDNPEPNKWRVRLVWPSLYGPRISRFEYFREK